MANAKDYAIIGGMILGISALIVGLILLITWLIPVKEDHFVDRVGGVRFETSSQSFYSASDLAEAHRFLIATLKKFFNVNYTREQIRYVPAGKIFALMKGGLSVSTRNMLLNQIMEMTTIEYGILYEYVKTTRKNRRTFSRQEPRFNALINIVQNFFGSLGINYNAYAWRDELIVSTFLTLNAPTKAQIEDTRVAAIKADGSVGNSTQYQALKLMSEQRLAAQDSE